MRARLRRDGIRFHEVVLPVGLLGDLRIAAGYLRDKVDATRRGDEVDKVDLVCHSAGGLVARYYVKYLGGDKHVRQIVHLGVPHQGTHFGIFFWALPMEIRRQTKPGSHFLGEVSGNLGVPELNLWSTIDGVVLPARHAVLDAANAVNEDVGMVTHWGFLWAESVYARVLEAIKGTGVPVPLS